MQNKTRNIIVVLVLLSVLLICCKNGSTESARSFEKKILSFTIQSHSLDGIIDNVSNSVHLKITPDIDRIELVPTIVISEGAIISPRSGIAQNFTEPVIYTVFAEDGSSQDYIIYSSVGNYILNTCLHIVHMQKHFISDLGIHNSAQVISSIKQILDLARAENIPVIYSKSLPAGNRDIIDELTPEEIDIVIESSSDDPIVEEINKLNVKKVVVVGILTNACIVDIVLELVQSGFEVILVCDATSVLSTENIELIEDSCQELDQNESVTLITTENVLF